MRAHLQLPEDSCSSWPGSDPGAPPDAGDLRAPLELEAAGGGELRVRMLVLMGRLTLMLK